MELLQEKAKEEGDDGELNVENIPWANTLAKWLKAHPPPPSTPQEREKAVQHHLEDIYKEIQQQEEAKCPTLAAIPRFFFKRPEPDDRLRQLLRKEARTRFLQSRSQELFDNDDLERLWTKLVEHAVHGENETDAEWIDWDSYSVVGKEVKEEVGEVKCSDFFKPSIFLRFLPDEKGRVSISSLFNHIMHKVSLRQMRISLSLYDPTGDGFLREQDMENYVFDLIPSFPQLRVLEESFYPFYVCTAVRPFIFFLDPMKKGKVSIKDILSSSSHAELMDLRNDIGREDEEEGNWFSPASALRVYGEYLGLDRDHNGMLSREELGGYGGGSLTDAFLDRIFQENHTYAGEMDYKTFLDFVLAMENKKEPSSLKYFFRLLDIRCRGAIGAFEIHFFFKSVMEKMRMPGHETVNPEDVRDEIFDMVKPANPLAITLNDLVESGVGDVVVSMLIDAAGFYDYDNRESLLVQQEPEEEWEKWGEDEDRNEIATLGARKEYFEHAMSASSAARRIVGGMGGSAEDPLH